MDKLDTEILNEIQWTFPLVAKPFDEIAKKFEISPDEVKEKLVQLKRKGVLRQLSAIFDTRKLGYTSSLVAMEIEPDKLEYVAHQINKHPGVSHNYEREHEFNLWFTLAVPPGSDLEKELEKFSKLDGIKKTRMLPTLQLFKIGVKLDMVDEKKHEVKPSEEKKKVTDVKFVPTEEDKEFIRQLQKDMEIVDRPFQKAAESLGMTEDQIFEKLHLLRRDWSYEKICSDFASQGSWLYCQRHDCLESSGTANHRSWKQAWRFPTGKPLL